MRSDKQLYDLSIQTDCFKALDKMDKSKITRRRQGERTMQPRSYQGIVIWELGYRAWLYEQQPEPTPEPPKPEPPVDPHYGIAPRTYNYAPSNNSDPRFCVHG